MFGPDTELIFGAMQMAAVVAGVTGGAVFLLVRKPWKKKTKSPDAPAAPAQPSAKTDLEERVEVLERIATDRSIDLADEIEALRKTPPNGERESAQ